MRKEGVLGRLRTQLLSMRMWVQSLASISELRIQHCYKLQHRSQIWLRYLLLWLWCRLAAAALIQPLAQEFAYAAGATQKRKKKNTLNSNGEEKNTLNSKVQSLKYWQ